MAQIPLYQQSVARTADSPAAPAPVGAPVAKSLERLGGTIAGLGAKFYEKKKDLREKAEISDYEVRRKKLQNDLVAGRNEYLTKQGGSYDRYFDDVVAPAMEEFERATGEAGYSGDSIERINQRWAIDRESIVGAEIAEREQMELADYTTRIRDEAFLMINSDDEATRQAGLDQIDTLTDIIGGERVADMKSLGVYNRNVNKVMSMQTPQEINEFAKSDEARSMQPQQYQAFLNMANGHVRKMTAEQYAPAKKEASDAIRKGSATSGFIKSLGLPPNEENLYLKILDDNIEKSYTKNEILSDELTAEVDLFLAGDYSGSSTEEYDKLLEKFEEYDLPPAVKLDIMLPIIEGQGDTSLNAPFFIGKKNQSIYDEMQSVVLNQYRDAFNAANSGMKADLKRYGFGNGYREVMAWIVENKGDMKRGKIPQDAQEVITRAVQPVVSNRIKLEERKRDQKILEGEQEKPDEVDSIWDEV